MEDVDNMEGDHTGGARRGLQIHDHIFSWLPIYVIFHCGL